MGSAYKFNRLELAGSLGDLGTLLPIAAGLVLINGLNPMGIFLSIGLFYIVSGIYFGVTTPVQPMKVIGAYAIATAATAQQILAAGALIGLFLLFIGLTKLITVIGRWVPKSVIRGVQLSTGTLLMAEGVKFMVGTSKFQIFHQLAEPYLSIQRLGFLPIGIVIGVLGGLLTLLLLDNKKFPAGLVIVVIGLVIGVLLGTHKGFSDFEVGVHLPDFMPLGLPSRIDFVFALFALALPQLPMTLGNAVIANADLSKEYFGADSNKVSYRGLTISMALANFLSFFLGGMPLCHGAGGLAAHYRFGARTVGSNLIIGGIFLIVALFLGDKSLALINLIPMSILGIMLLFAGSQLALTILDLKERKELFVALTILGITMASNLAIGFVAGVVLARLLKNDRFSV
ncbi:putative sulfate/molybdate transporter [bacterium]|nr:putative sulfate/molybdate transporter [bacterium]